MIRKIVLCLFFLSPLAFAQGVFSPVQTALKSVNGQTMPFPGATITVCGPNASGIPCSPVLTSTLFQDSALSEPLSNPFFAGANGNYQFAAVAAQYTVTVTGAGFNGYSYQASLSSGGAATLASTYANNQTTGTFCNELVKQDASGNAIVTAGGETSGVIGVASIGCVPVGSPAIIPPTVTVVFAGDIQIIFDTSLPTVSDYVGISALQGRVTDVGATPSTGQNQGQVRNDPNTGAAPSNCTITPGCWVHLELGSGSGGGGTTGANPALSNLVAPAVNLAPAPQTDNAINLNDASHRWVNMWLSGVIGNASSGAPFAGLTFLTSGVVNCGNGSPGDVTCTFNAANGNFGTQVNVGGGSPACGTFSNCMAFTFGNTGSTTPAAGNGFFKFISSNNHVWLSIGSTEFDSLMNLPALASSITGLYTGCTTAQYLDSDGTCHYAPLVLKVGSSNFTTAASTSLQVITGLSDAMPASVAGVMGFNCDVTWSQATAAVAVAFGVQGATTAPTNLEASGTMYPNTTTLATGTLTALTTTTATSVVSATPSAIATIWRALVSGTLEFPSNASPTVFNLLVSTATSGDVVTVYRGSKCVLNFQ